jgi:hypothetical protein
MIFIDGHIVPGKLRPLHVSVLHGTYTVRVVALHITLQPDLRVIN